MLWATYLQESGSLASLVLSALALVLFFLSAFQVIKLRELQSGKLLERTDKISKVIKKNLQNSEGDAMRYSDQTGTDSGIKKGA